MFSCCSVYGRGRVKIVCVCVFCRTTDITGSQFDVSSSVYITWRQKNRSKVSRAGGLEKLMMTVIVWKRKVQPVAAECHKHFLSLQHCGCSPSPSAFSCMEPTLYCSETVTVVDNKCKVFRLCYILPGPVIPACNSACVRTKNSLIFLV